MLGSLKRTVLTKAIQKNWSADETLNFMNEILDSLEYYEPISLQELIEQVKYMQSQKSGIYGGLSTNDITVWLIRLLDLENS